MAEKQFPVSVVIRGVDKVSGPLRAVQAKLQGLGRVAHGVGSRLRTLGEKSGLPRLSAAVGNANKAFGRLGSRVMAVGRGLGYLAGAAGLLVGATVLVGSSLLKTASEFEKYNAILTTIEGSSEKAGKAMSWVSEFAARTPYELGEVTDNFVKLRAYGIDPMDGAFKTLGDTAAAMGKPLNMAVEALADAITGENERLKEFGIKAKKTGNKITYEYSQDGKTIRKTAKANNRAMIQSTLMGIWNSKYAGAMDKLSGTWGGMMSNLSDQWARFKLMIMKSGAFDFMSKKLGDLLVVINKMADSGELQKIANYIGVLIKDALIKLWETGVKIKESWPEIVQTFQELKEKLRPIGEILRVLNNTFGTSNTIIGVLAGVMLAVFLPSIIACASAMWGLTAAMWANPVGITIALFIALAAVIAYFSFEVENGEIKLTKFGRLIWNISILKQIWEINDTIDGLKLRFELMGQIVDAAFKRGGNAAIMFRNTLLGVVLPPWAQALFGGQKPLNFKADFNPVGRPQGASLGAGTLGREAAANSQTNVKIDFANMPPGAKVTTETTKGKAPNLQLNQGYALPKWER